ncbi:PREDICTED: heterogeneous nuclear ribonucleoproteins A2/B1-like [Papilio xuthus]|uniref:Heterogeneous nuclear ribonucleoproteins A2/B1-like n=1 Tax=Papilio xuthus TaxID=66420 RepID=A0AAJ6ZMG7_PAPXU|nr:PREDICTED: heterogeneous nuclear ribonucleoproteins A2/B1-like [Papilio xuthus]
MGFSVVVSVVALAGLACATVGDNALDSGERVVLVAPVLAPPKDSRTHANDRSRQFPILVLLAQESQPPSGRETSAKSLGINPQPIYVQKLEDQENAQAVRPNRQKRHLLKSLLLGGGGGGGISFGGGFGLGGGYGGGYGGHGGYEEPTKTIVLVKEHGHGRGYGGGYGGHGGYHGGYDNGGYGNGGGYNNGGYNNG